MLNEYEETRYEQLADYAKKITYATETKGVSVAVKRIDKELLQPQKYEVGFYGGSRFESQVLTYEQAWLVIEGIEILIRMLYM